MSAIFNVFRNALVVVLFSITAGCVNLEEVQKFTEQSAALSSSNEITGYLDKGAARRAKLEETNNSLLYSVNCDEYSSRQARIQKKKKSEITCPPLLTVPPFPAGLNEDNKKSIASLHVVISDYMAKLAVLSGSDVVSLDKSTDELVSNLNKLPYTAESASKEEKEKRNAAYGAMVKLISIPLDLWRQHELKRIIQENDESIGTLANLLASILRDQAGKIDSESKVVSNWYNLADSTFPADTLEGALYVKNERDAKLAEISSKKKAAEAYSEALLEIKNTHHKLATESGSLDSDSGKQIIEYVKAAREKVVAARKQYDEAFKGESSK
ncbi:hypothetical protein [Pseudomonas entomophila]|nr:hypothetical protein [Pseudomonas entomophila]WMW03894.1 hypothetical protein RAH46_16310 [Pseudomonas entomophila]